MELRTFIYSVKVWLTTVVIGPAVYSVIYWLWQHICGTIGDTVFRDIINNYGYVILFELVFSVSTWFVFFLVIYLIVKVSAPRLWKRLIFLAGIVLTGLTFAIVFNGFFSFDMNTNYFLMMISYGTCIVGSIRLYRLAPKTNLVGKY